MTAASYTTNLTNIYTSDSEDDTNWSALGGGAAGLNIPETDYYIQGTACATKNAFASDVKGMIRDNVTDHGGSPTDGAYVAWMTHTAPNSLDTKAGGGMRFCIGSGTGAYHEHYVGGSDTMSFLKWEFVAVKEQSSYEDSSVGSPSTTVEDHIGGVWDLPSGGPTKGAPNGIDGIRVGRVDCVMEHGTAPDAAATWAAALAVHDSSTNRYGTITQREPGGAIENSGLIQFGTSTNALRFTDSNKTINIRAHDHVTANFNTWEFNHASTVVTMSGMVIKALGGNSVGRFVVNNNATLDFSSCTFIDMGTFALDTNSTFNACVWQGCGRIEGEADLANSTIDSPTVAADEGAIFDDRTTTASTILSEYDNMTIVKGTNAHHALRFGTGVDDDITLRDIEFTGFSGTDDVNDSTLRFDATTGSLTVNMTGCTVGGAAASASNIGVDAPAGLTVTLVFDTVSLKVTVVDSVSKLALPDARVYLHKDGDTGTVYFNDECDVNGEVTDSITYPGDTDVVGWAREMSQTGTDYHPKNIAGQITSSGLDILVELDPL